MKAATASAMLAGSDLVTGVASVPHIGAGARRQADRLSEKARRNAAAYAELPPAKPSRQYLRALARKGLSL